MHYYFIFKNVCLHRHRLGRLKGYFILLKGYFNFFFEKTRCRGFRVVQDGLKNILFYHCYFQERVPAQEIYNYT